MATIRITDLKLQAIIGTNEWERKTPQDIIIINIIINYNADNAIESDALEDTVDYNLVIKEVIEKVATSNFFLVEKLADVILNIIMENNMVVDACVRIDKPNALKFSKSVSIELKKCSDT